MPVVRLRPNTIRVFAKLSDLHHAMSLYQDSPIASGRLPEVTMMLKLPDDPKEQGPANLSQLQAASLVTTRTDGLVALLQAQASAMAGVIKKAGVFAHCAPHRAWGGQIMATFAGGPKRPLEAGRSEPGPGGQRQVRTSSS